MKFAAVSKNEALSQIQSALSIKIHDLEKQQALYQQLADKYMQLKAQTSEEEEVYLHINTLICINLEYLLYYLSIIVHMRIIYCYVLWELMY